MLVGGERVKVARNLKLGERLSIAIGDIERAGRRDGPVGREAGGADRAGALPGDAGVDRQARGPGAAPQAVPRAGAGDHRPADQAGPARPDAREGSRRCLSASAGSAALPAARTKRASGAGGRSTALGAGGRAGGAGHACGRCAARR